MLIACSFQAMKGSGVDRHLLGLKLAAKELGIEVPKLFTDAGFVRSSHMRISTSQVRGFSVDFEYVNDLEILIKIFCYYR